MIDLSTLTPADIGRQVLYTGLPHQPGTITSWNPEFIFVRYGKNPVGSATSPKDLVFYEPLDPPMDDLKQLLFPSLADNLRFFRLIDEDERIEPPSKSSGYYKLACGHHLFVAPALPDSLLYLPCPECARAWEKGEQPVTKFTGICIHCGQAVSNPDSHQCP